MKTEYEKCMAGESFDGSSPEITEMAVRNKRLLQQLRNTDYADNEEKQRIYREMFGSIGEDVYIDIDFRCEYGRNIHFGNKVIVNMNCTFLDNNRINIGNNVMIAPMSRYLRPLTRSIFQRECRKGIDPMPQSVIRLHCL